MKWAGRLITVLLGVSICCAAAHAQSDAQKILLDKARSLDTRGRLDLAAQNWQQVLLSDSRNTEALAGIARAYMSAGKPESARPYLNRLREINPHDPRIQKIEGMSSQKTVNTQLQRAGKLAAAGQYAEALALYRQSYGNNPPPCDTALAYFQTEAATPDGRGPAIAGLRDCVHKYPGDSRYEITLAGILTYEPKTRAEGIALLKKHSTDGTANEALHQALLWDAGNPGAAGTIRSYLKAHPDEELQGAVNETEARQLRISGGLAKTADERAAYAALQANHLDVAESRFQEIHDRQPANASAMAGLGFVSMKQSNFAGAVEYFESAKANGAKDRSVDTALATSRFWLGMTEAGSALAAGNVSVALEQYKQSVETRPTNTDALRGLAGTLLRADEPAEAAQIYARLVRAQPSDADNWRGLVTAHCAAGDPRGALEVVTRLPLPVRATLERDPQYLSLLAGAYADSGDEAGRERVLAEGMELPFPQNGKGMKPEEQIAFAGLLLQAKRYDQAAGLYRQVIEQDPDNLAAYEALVRAQHAMGKDGLALATIEEMPPEALIAAERDAGFMATIAAIYQSQGKLDIAQMFMEQAVASSTSDGKQAPVTMQLQLAAIYVVRGNATLAYPMYRRILTADPARVDAWTGLFNALHDAKRDHEALTELQQVPAKVMALLNQDLRFLQTLASIYNSAGDPAQALRMMRLVVYRYQQKNGTAPADFSIQYCYLLLNAGDDQSLYAQLMKLGARQDLTEEQRTHVQTVWADWSVRRATVAAKAGNNHRALQILDAANHAFPENADVQKALAGGYMQAGQAKRAETIYLQMDWTSATVEDYRGALGASLKARDLKQAAVWLDTALRDYSNDPQILQRAAQYEQARGNTQKAAAYYQDSLDAMGPGDPALALMADVKQPLTDAAAARSRTNPGQDLIHMLAQNMPPAGGMEQPMIETPVETPADYLPGQAPVPMRIKPADTTLEPMLPAQTTAKKSRRGVEAPKSAPPQNVERLGQYSPPQGQLTPGDLCALNRMAGVACSSSANSDGAGDAKGWTVKPVSWVAPKPVAEAEDSRDFTQAPNSQPMMTTVIGGLGQQSTSMKPQPTLRDEVTDQLAALQGGYSPWIGGTAMVSYRSGQPGFDHFVVFSEPLEASAVINNSVRATIVVKPVLLDAGTSTGTTTLQQGTNPIGCGSTPGCTIYTQTASGTGGELQLRSNNFGVSVGYSPYGFLVSTVIGSLYANPGAGPWTFTFNRDSVVDTQLAYSGLVNTGTSFHNQVWGGVVANSVEGQFAKGSDHSGFYIQGGGQYITGDHVQTNGRADGDAGAYWRAASWADYGTVTFGMNMFAMHYDHNLRYFTYGQGGYFSPDAYLLANVPVRFDGHSGTNFHYRIDGSLGIQAFQEDAAPYFPLDEATLGTQSYPTRDSISGNYLFDAEGSYRVAEHWFAGGTFSANNSRGYNSVNLGFFVRYMFRPQFPTEEGPPTGIFPVIGLRPMQVP